MWPKHTATSYASLPLSVAHHLGEPAPSLIARVAARNGVLSVQEFCRDIRFPYLPLLAGQTSALQLLAQLSGNDFPGIEAASIRDLRRTRLRLRNEYVTAQSCQRTRLRCCSECVLADVGGSGDLWRAWQRGEWQFNAMRSCLVHGCELQALPAEKHTLRGYDFTAQLRKHWSVIERARSSPCSQSSFEVWLSERIGGRRGQGWIDQLELNVASRACEILGLRLLKGPNVKLSGWASHEWRRFADAGYQVLRKGQSAFETVLTELLEEAGVDRRFYMKVYGPLTVWLNGSGIGSEFEPLRAIVRNHIIGHFSVRRGVLVLGRPSEGKHAYPFISDPIRVPSSLEAVMLRRDLAVRSLNGEVVPEGFVTGSMIGALKREVSQATGETDRFERRRFCGNAPVISGVNERAQMSAKDVVERLRITKPTVFYLVRNGILKLARTDGAAPNGTVQISEHSVLEFEETYVSLGVLVAERQCKQGALMIRLRNAEIQMLAVPPKYSRIFWKTDIEAYENGRSRV